MSANTIRPVVLPSGRDEKAVKKVRDSLTSWAGYYRSGDVLKPNKNKKEPTAASAKGGDKESYGISTSKRTGIREKLASLAEDFSIMSANTQDPKSMQYVTNQSHPMHRTIYFTVLNIVGSIAEISMFLAQRLTKSNHYFDLDATQFGIVAFLQGALQDPEAVVDFNNVSLPGNMKVLEGFQMYANAKTEEEEYDAITTLYNDFVVGIVDRGADYFATRIYGHGGQNVKGTYNSSVSVRSEIWNRMTADITHASSVIYPYASKSDLVWPELQPIKVGPGAVAANPEVKDLTSADNADLYLVIKAYQKGIKVYVEQATSSTRIPTVHEPRLAWLANKGTPKRKSEENQMNLDDIPVYASFLRIVDEIVATVPAKFRPEQKIPVLGANNTTEYISRSSYPLLGLNPANAHKLIYSHGITFSATPVDINPGRLADINGKSKRLLTGSQALEGIVKRVSGYFDIENGKSNIQMLLNRDKYIDISSNRIDFTQNSGYHINGYTNSGTALLFPDAPAPAILDSNGQFTMSKEKFAERPDLVLDLIVFSLGFTVGKVAINHELIQAAVKGLYNVFSEVVDVQVPTMIQYNVVPVDKAGAHNFMSSSHQSMQMQKTMPPTHGSLKSRTGAAFSAMAMPVAPQMHSHHLGGQTAPLAAPQNHYQQQPQMMAPAGPSDSGMV